MTVTALYEVPLGVCRAGVVIPESGRARAFALGQLRSLAERNGYPVRDHRVSAQSA